MEWPQPDENNVVHKDWLVKIYLCDLLGKNSTSLQTSFYLYIVVLGFKSLDCVKVSALFDDALRVIAMERGFSE